MQLGVRCAWKGKVSHDDCRACSMQALHPCGFPPDVLEAMRATNDKYDGSGFTASTLLECDRRTALYTSRDHWLDPESAWFLMRGHMVHSFMEGLPYPPGSVVCLVREKRLKTAVDTRFGPQLFSGKMDLAVVKRIEDVEVGVLQRRERVAYVKIVDYKTKKIDHGLVESPRNNQMQVNMYAWLVQETLLHLGVPELDGVDKVVVDEVELVYVDMMKTRRFTSSGLLPAKGKEVRKPAWGLHEDTPLDDMNLEKVQEFRSLRGARIPVLQSGGKCHELLALDPIYLFPDMKKVEEWIAGRIEAKIEAKEVLPPRLEGDEAAVCRYCPMYELCYSLPE